MTIVTGDNTEDSTNIVAGTYVERAYKRWCEKQKQIDDLEYESILLIDAYYNEMGKARIPMCFSEGILEELFAKDAKKKRWAREFFLKQTFSEKFLEGHKVEFVRYAVHGYGRYAVGIDLGIGDYLYTVEIPLPANIINPEDRKILMGQVKFRVDRLHKSKTEEFVKEMEAVQMPTYDWKKCFEAIEAIVEKEGSKNG